MLAALLEILQNLWKPLLALLAGLWAKHEGKVDQALVDSNTNLKANTKALAEVTAKVKQNDKIEESNAKLSAADLTASLRVDERAN